MKLLLSKRGWVLAGITAAAFALRFVGLKFGLPELYHADEPIVVNHAMAYGTGDLNPHFFQIPPLVSYVLFFIYGLYYCAGTVLGKFHGVDSFVDLFFTDPSSFYFLGRLLLGAVTGTATVLALYFLARRVVSERAGIWAAAFLAVAFLHVRDSHYIYTDIPLCLALVITELFILNIYERGSLKDYIWAGALVGLCVSLKYNAALVGGSYLLAHLLRKGSWKEKLSPGPFLAGVAACFAVFLLTNPFAFLDFSFFCQSFAAQGKAQGFVGWMHHLSHSLVSGIGGYALVAALVGIGLSFYLKNAKALVLLGFLVPFYLGITFFGQVHDRYVLPLIPFLAVFLGLFIEWILQTSGERWRRWLVTAFAVAFIFPMAIKSAYSDWLFLQPDSRTLAKNWIEANVPAGTKIALDHTFYVPRLLPTREQLQEKLESAKNKEASSGAKQKKLERLLALARPEEKRYNLYFLSNEPDSGQGYLFAEPRIPLDFDRMKEEGIQVVVTHRLGAYKPNFDFFAQVDKNSKDMQRFSPYKAAWQDFSLEPYVRTAGAFLWPEMLARRSNGEFVAVYLLE